MTDIRPSELTAKSNVASNSALIFDDLLGVWKCTPAELVTGAGVVRNVDLTGLKAAAITEETLSLYSAGIQVGLFSWETANAPYTADDVNVVKANSTALSVGAWVRQPLSGKTVTILDNGTTAQTDFLHVMPQSAINSEGGYDNVDFSIRTVKGYTANYGDGTFGTDYIYGIGWNIGPALFPAQSGKPASMFKIESKYRYNRFGTYVTHAELHAALVTKDAVAAEFRPITIGAPHAKADWANLSGVTLQTAYIAMIDGAIAPVERLTFDFRALNGGVGYITGTSNVYREATNNFAFRRQLNAAANAYVNLPYIDGNDHVKFDAKISAGARFADYFCQDAVLVVNLPSAVTAGVGARLFVTDANSTTFASTVAGSGTNKVPVYSDGANWKIG